MRTRWVHFPLHPETPPEGVDMKTLYQHRDPEERKAAGDHIRAAMAAEGLTYNRRTRLDNSRLAQELGAWADTQPGGEAIHDALYRAYFVEDRCISDLPTLVEIAEAVGLDGGEAAQVLKERSFSPKVTEDWERAWLNGVTGVPTFSYKDLYVFGAQPYEVLLRFVNHLRKLRAEQAGT